MHVRLSGSRCPGMEKLPGPRNPTPACNPWPHVVVADLARSSGRTRSLRWLSPVSGQRSRKPQRMVVPVDSHGSSGAFGRARGGLLASASPDARPHAGAPRLLRGFGARRDLWRAASSWAAFARAAASWEALLVPLLPARAGLAPPHRRAPRVFARLHPRRAALLVGLAPRSFSRGSSCASFARAAASSALRRASSAARRSRSALSSIATRFTRSLYAV